MKWFERIREFLSKSTAEFVLVYRGKVTKDGVELKLCRAVARGEKSREEYDRLAAYFQEIALHSFRNKQSIIIRQTPAHANPQIKRWCGLDILREPYEGPLLTNSIGQSWWHFVVEPVDNHIIGYVIIAKVAAKEEKEVDDYIRKIYHIMRG